VTVGDGDGIGISGDGIGDIVGDGIGDGDSVGDGETVGLTVGETVGLTVGETVGETVGDKLNLLASFGEFTAAKIPDKRNKLAPVAKMIFLNIN